MVIRVQARGSKGCRLMNGLGFVALCVCVGVWVCVCAGVYGVCVEGGHFLGMFRAGVCQVLHGRCQISYQ